MSNISSFTGKFRLHSNHGTPGTKITKRPRPSTVCTQCRSNKLRCDRGQPCSNCVRRDQEAACNYEIQGSPADNGRNAERRLDHLETMVRELMENRAAKKNANNIISDSVTPPETPAGVRNAQQNDIEYLDHANYAGSTHWSSILEDIYEIKVALGSSAAISAAGDPVPMDMPSLDSEPIFGLPSGYSMQRIIDQFPKVELDRCLAVFFRTRTFIVPFVHTFHFQRQYRDFWELTDPTSCNPIWLSLLYSICYIGSLVEGATGLDSANTTGAASSGYLLHFAAGQCLVLGHYHRPQQFGPEALAMYAHCKNMKTLDPSREAATILGLSVRMAYEMG